MNNRINQSHQPGSPKRRGRPPKIKSVVNDEFTQKRKMAFAVNRANEKPAAEYNYPVQPPVLAPGVVPKGVAAPVAMDSTYNNFAYAAFQNYAMVHGFPGYPYLSQLTVRPEYRSMANALSTEITREWIELTSSESGGEATAEKIKILNKEMERLQLRDIIQTAVEQDCFFGRAQLFIDLRGHDNMTPLILSNKTIEKGALIRISTVEAIWTTPVAYNALQPQAPDFYKPSAWFMLGQEVHASRLLTVITRPVPDMLKAAFNFGGISLSQLAEPYVNNWLRTRQSVSDLINNFSTTCLATSMDQVLQDGDDGVDIFKRADLFTATRSNKGLMLLDKEREELVQVNTPLGGLHELQAQAQEHMSAVSRIPLVKLTGISPSGLNASSDGEMRAWYDWVSSQQEAFWRSPIDIILKVMQLSLFGEIDDDISFKFVSLYQIQPLEESQIKLNNATAANIYLAAGVVGPDEERKRLADDPESGYEGLDAEQTAFMPPDTQPAAETDPDEEPESESQRGDPA
jgi:phage-related protein (TIGR01555 family)